MTASGGARTIAIDANVWIYYLDSGVDEHERVRGPVRRALRERALFVNGVVPLEVSHYLANRGRDSDRFVRGLLGMDGVEVEPVDLTMVRRADEILDAHPHVGVGGRDASLVAAMERRGVAELWTHDDGLKRLGGRLGWLGVTDPVAS